MSFIAHVLGRVWQVLLVLARRLIIRIVLLVCRVDDAMLVIELIVIYNDALRSETITLCHFFSIIRCGRQSFFCLLRR